jgi:hypothetical protein
LSWGDYNRWKASWDEFVAALPKKMGLHPLSLRRWEEAGRPFVQLVIEALDANRITSVQASRYLDLRFDHFDNLRAELRIGHRRRTGARDEGD